MTEVNLLFNEDLLNIEEMIDLEFVNSVIGIEDQILFNSESTEAIVNIFINFTSSTNFFISFLGEVYESSTYPNFQNILEELLLKAFSFKKIHLKGLKVKSKNNKKFVPSIVIYVKRINLSILPDTLEFSRAFFSVQKTSSWSVEFNSPILKSLLSSRSLCFLDNKKATFELSLINKNEYSLYSQEVHTLAIDRFINESVQENIFNKILSLLPHYNKNNSYKKNLEDICASISNGYNFNTKEISVLSNLVSSMPKCFLKTDKMLKKIEWYLISKRLIYPKDNSNIEQQSSILKNISPPVNSALYTIRHYKEGNSNKKSP